MRFWSVSGSILGAFFDPFWLHFGCFFALAFRIVFLMAFGSLKEPCWLLLGPKKSPKTLPDR